ncbi:MAG: hypothetical protein GY940_28390 [bacterium]|nr:hypothetical protein [bacterium]
MVIKILCEFPAGDLRFATQNLQDGSGNWQNKIISISSLSRNIGEDKSYEVSGISIELDDNDRFFRQMMSGDHRYIPGKTVEIRGEDDSLIYTGAVEKWQFKEDAFVLFINDKLSGLETLIPGLISKDDYPNMADKSNGQPVPLIYGHLEEEGNGAVKCWKVNKITNPNKYLLARHHCDSLIGDAYNEDGSTITLVESDLENNLVDGRSYVKCNGTGDFIYVNVRGKEDQSQQLMEDPVEVLKDIIDNYTGMEYDISGMDNAADIMAKRNYKIAGIIDGQKNLQDVLKDFSFSFDCDFYIGKGKKVMISMLNWSQLEPVKSLDESQVVDFNMEELPDEIKNTVKYRYKYNQALKEYQREPVYTQDESVAGWGEFYNRNEPLDLLYVSDDDSAFDVVQRYVIQRTNPRRLANMDIPLPEFLGLDISDVVEVQHPGAIDAVKRKYQVRRTNIDFISDIVQVEAVDITTLTGGVFLLGDRDSLQPGWELAGDNDRNFGYRADSVTGYFEGGIDYGKVLY